MENQDTNTTGSFITKMIGNITYNLVIYIILLIVLFLGLIMFFIYPIKILKDTYIPFTIFYLFITFTILIYIIVYTNKRNENSNIFDFFRSFSKHSLKLLSIIVILLLISFILYFFVSGIKQFFKFLLSYSFWFPFGLVIIILAIINQYTHNYTFNNTYFNLIVNFILYIPCLLTDAIEFIKKDYNDTPSTVIILFFILVAYLLLYFFLPLLNYIIFKSDGLLLIDKPLYLNTNIIRKSRSELMEEIFNNRPFYDRWTQEILNTTNVFKKNTTTESDSSFNYYFRDDVSGTELSNNLKINYISVIPDEYTKKFYENFTTAQGNDSLPIMNSLNFLSLAQQNVMIQLIHDNPDIENKLNELSEQPETLKEYVLSIINNNPQLLSIYDKIMLIVNNVKAITVATVGIPGDLNKSYVLENDLTGNLYHYGISFWIYLNNSNNLSGKQTIVTYGNRPSLYFDGTKKQLLLEINKDIVSSTEKNSDNILYKTNDILYQKWNHIVMNYNYGTFDLFINNNLVGSYKNIVPKLFNDEMLVVGSDKNGNLGGICNMKYYELPIPLSKIEQIYKTFHKKNPPI